MDDTSHATPRERTWRSDDSGYLTTTPSPPNCSDSAGYSIRTGNSRKRELKDTPLFYCRKLPKCASGSIPFDCSLNDADQHELSDPFLSIPVKLPESTPVRSKGNVSTDTSECSTILSSFSDLQVSNESRLSDVCETSISSVEVEDCHAVTKSVTEYYERTDSESHGAASQPVVLSKELELPLNKFKKVLQKENTAFQPCVFKRKRSLLSRELFEFPRKSLIGLPYVDFLVQLCEAGSYQLILSKVLSYLNPEDIIRMSLVCRAWYRICTADKKANSRRLAYVERAKYSKENLDWWNTKSENDLPPHCRAGPFREIQNLTNINNGNNSRRPPPPQRSPPVSPTKIRFKMFVKAGGAVESGGRLVPCPRCSRPSHIKAFSTSAQCSLESCKYTFCILCFCDCHDGQPCSAARRPPPKHRSCSIGSVESKRNLRRL